MVVVGGGVVDVWLDVFAGGEVAIGPCVNGNLANADAKGGDSFKEGELRDILDSSLEVAPSCSSFLLCFSDISEDFSFSEIVTHCNCKESTKYKQS